MILNDSLSNSKYYIANHCWRKIKCLDCQTETKKLNSYNQFNSNLKQELSNEKLKWNWLPKAFCISLKERTKRRIQVMKEFHRVGLCKKIIFYITERDKKSPVRGCWESHRQIAKKSLEEKLDWYLVFEDDVHFKPSFNQNHIDKIERCLNKLPTNWNSLYWGGLPKYLFYFNLTNDFAQWKGWNLHAIMISKRLAKVFSNNSFDDINHVFQDGKFIEVDHWFTKFDNHYIVFPPVALTKDDGQSDLNQERSSFVQYLHQWKNKNGSIIEEVICWIHVFWIPLSILFIFTFLIICYIFYLHPWIKNSINTLN